MLQYLISSSEQSRARERELLEIEKDRIQNAINLASYYKDNILDNIAIIDSIYEDTIAKNSIIYGFGEKAKFTTTTTDENGRILGTVNINKMEKFREYANILMMLLNNIEYFAMNFTHETADRG